MGNFLETLIKNIKLEGRESEVTALVSTHMSFDEATLLKYPFVLKWKNETGKRLSDLEVKNPGLSGNTNIDWTPELVYKFADYLDWRIFPFTLAKNRQFMMFECLQKISKQITPALADQWKLVDFTFILIGDIDRREYFDDIVFINQSFFLDHVWFESPITEDIIAGYVDQWDWDILSACLEIDFSERLLKKYADKWNWKKISANSKIPWTYRLVKHFQKEIDWLRFSEKEFFDLHKNKLLPLYQKHMGDLRPLKISSGQIFNN